MSAPDRTFRVKNGEAFNPSPGTEFTVRLVAMGETHGLNGCLTHDQPEPLVEFYDLKYAGEDFGPLGQFVACYYLAEVVRRHAFRPFALDAGIPRWTLDDAATAAAAHGARLLAHGWLHRDGKLYSPKKVR